MRILFINTLYEPYVGGGAEITLKALVDGLKSRGHDVYVLTTGPDKGVTIDSVDGVKVYRVGIKNIYWHHRKTKAPFWQRFIWNLLDIYNPAMGKIVEQVMEDVRPDVVNCHNLAGFSSATWAAIEKRGIPSLQVLHDVYSLCFNSNMFIDGHPCEQQCSRCKAFRMPHKNLSKKVSAVVGVSEFILERHFEFGLFENARVKTWIHNSRVMKPKERLNYVAENEITFGFIGTLSAAKGVEYLIQSFLKIDSQKTINLLIAGAGQEPYQTELKRYESDRIHFVGHTTQDAFFSKIDVLVVPSLWNEPLGMVVIEAFANGLPVIGSRRGGIPEMIIEGTNGFLFEPETEDELTGIMQRLTDDSKLIAKMRPKAYKSAKPYLKNDAWLAKYEKVYLDLFTFR